MDTFKNKRKKRKTRRCLDEIRKNRNTDGKVYKKKSICLKNNYITNNRLTLFNKAVRSETVTRIQRNELEGNKIKFNKDRETIISNAVSVPIEQNDKVVAETQIQDITDDNSEIEISSPNLQIDCEMKTPNSAILFSPEYQIEEEAINNNPDNSIENSSPSTIDTNIVSKIFCDIMDKMEIYAQKIFPDFDDIDIIEKSKEKIRKLCSEYGNNYSTCTSQIVNLKLLRNRPYISPDFRILHNSRKHNGYSSSEHSESNTSEIQESSPIESTRHSSNSIYIPSTPPVLTSLYNTPEYTYYPHRLN